MIKLYIDNYHVHYLLLTVYIIYWVSTLYIIDCIYRLLYVYICSALRLRRKIKYLSIYLYVTFTNHVLTWDSFHPKKSSKNDQHQSSFTYFVIGV